MMRRVLMALVGILAAATVASAANKEGSFSLSPVIGGYTFDDAQRLGPDNNLIFGGRAGYNFTKSLGVEGLFDYVREGDMSVDMYRYGGELLYHFFPDNKFVPYLAAGAGGISFKGTGQDKNTRLAIDGGFGAKYFLFDNIALRGDLRAIYYDRSGRGNTNLEYTLGAYIPFGGATAATKAVEAKPAPAPVVVSAPLAHVAALPPLPIVSFTVNPGNITKGQPATLSWSSQNATQCNIQPSIGIVPPQGSRVVRPEVGTTFDITCNGDGGSVGKSAVITVDTPAQPLLPIVSFTVDPGNITKGQPATLSWNSQNATQCNIQPAIGMVPPQGSRVVRPEVGTTFDITCNGDGGSVGKSATIIVNTPEAAVTTPVLQKQVVAPGTAKVCRVPNKITIQFDTGKINIKPRYEGSVKSAGAFLKEYPAAKSTVSGFTDSTGKKAYNYKLSQRRAQKIKNVLVNSYGISSKRVATKGFGANKPVASNKSRAGRAQNRRVEMDFSCE